MAKETATIAITFAYEPETHGGMPLNVWLHLLLFKLNVETPITALEYKGTRRSFTEEDLLGNLPLRLVDSINEADIPTEQRNMQMFPEGAIDESIPEDQRPTVLDFSKPPITHTTDGRTPADRR